MYCPNTKCLGSFCLHKKTFISLGRSDYQCLQCASVCQCQLQNITFEEQTNSFFLSLGRGVYSFEENLKASQEVIEVVYCPGEYCLNREKRKSIDVYVTTPRSTYGCDNCGAWLFVHKVLFTLEEHVKTTKTDKTRFFFAKKRWTCYTTNNCSIKSHFNQPILDWKNCVWTTSKLLELCILQHRNEKCVYISSKKMTSFHDCKKCKACCHLFNIPFEDQKPTIMMFGGNDTHCFARKTSHDYEKEKPSPFLKKFLRQSISSKSECSSKKLNWFQIWKKLVRFQLAGDLSNIFSFQIFFIQFQSTVNRYSTYNQLTENHDLLSLQRRNPVDCRFCTRLCYYCSKWSRPKYNNQTIRSTPCRLAIGVVSKTRLFEQSSSASANYSQPRGNNGDERRSTLQCGSSIPGH